MDQLSNRIFRSIYGEPGTAVATAYTDTSASSASALTAGITYRLVSTTDCHITFAASPTATTSHTYLAAGQPMYVTMTNSYHVAAIRATANGTLFATPMTGYRV